MPKTLRLILGDQLNPRHSWFREQNDQVIYLIAELPQEVGYVKHHVQKICAFFAAMAQFAMALEQAGHRVWHLTLDDTSHLKDLPDLLNQLIEKHDISAVEYQRPDEYRLLEQLRAWAVSQSIPVFEADTEHFLLPIEEIPDQFKAGKAHRMEFFYRRMRQRFDILMQQDTPEGGRWNFDTENRQTLKPEDLRHLPEPLTFVNDVSSILDRLKRHNVSHFGRAENTLLWPVTRRQAESLLAFFCTHLLPRFGQFQDAMTHHPDGWSLYHSRLSFALNAKMLHPMQVIEAAMSAYRTAPEQIPLSQIEGFVRQILGWREFVRGIYWANMPAYAEQNALQAERTLPDYFWQGDTQMACLQKALGQSLEFAYAHHIQRLMVIGNFCLLTGIDPNQVDAWYLGVYVDAIEWVEMPNTRGMSQFADGGLVASKPYIGGGNYINKMSDYCTVCAYDVKETVGEKACPFNSFYWHFIDLHQSRFESNPRMALVIKNWQKRDPAKKQAVLEQARTYLKQLNHL
ncbi:cryptochrome/photolyase family protein [Neptuniibacter sp. CAU 1671]|uniref:cryptochrome/photolyase family protein n=1 Tax=Neptuniibacter sp. CAU 1671 TaxID=3032593 RepID=UPI0023DC4CDF|nr:cryptochrome/photolyase family protein [Neptuniibacter sp. CAU 1671]MDF2181161.1 cryptochrome/photolyase family protein [Neptuniibacter sp. CAU 1671]